MKKGNLIIKFNVIFPAKMSQQCKDTIVKALKENDELNDL